MYFMAVKKSRKRSRRVKDSAFTAGPQPGVVVCFFDAECFARLR